MIVENIEMCSVVGLFVLSTITMAILPPLRDRNGLMLGCFIASLVGFVGSLFWASMSGIFYMGNFGSYAAMTFGLVLFITFLLGMDDSLERQYGSVVLSLLVAGAITLGSFGADWKASDQDIAEFLDRAAKLQPAAQDVLRELVWIEVRDGSLTQGELVRRMAPAPLMAALEQLEDGYISDKRETSKTPTERLEEFLKKRIPAQTEKASVK